MARDEDKLWYAAMRRLGLPADPKRVARMSKAEALEEFRAAPELPPPSADDDLPEIDLEELGQEEEKRMFANPALEAPLTFRDRPSRRARRRTAATPTRALAAAAAASILVVALVMTNRGTDGGAGPNPGPNGVGGSGGVAAVAPTGGDPLAGGENGGRTPADGAAGEDESGAPAEETAGKTVDKEEVGQKKKGYGETGKQKKKSKGYGEKGSGGMVFVTAKSSNRFLMGDQELSREEADERTASLDSPYLTAGDHVSLYTTNGIDFGERMLVTAEAAYRNAHRFFGKAPELGDDGKMNVFVVNGVDQYNHLGQYLGGDEKSSAFYAFATPWLDQVEGMDEWGEASPFDLLTVTQFNQAESLTDIYVTHATVEQFVRRLIGPDSPDPAPRWFIDGVACYIGRWQKANLTGWSGSRLKALGGAPKLKQLFRSYTPTEQTILSSGALVHFLKGDACPEEVRKSFSSAIVAINDGRKVTKAFRKFEKSVLTAESEFETSLQSW